MTFCKQTKKHSQHKLKTYFHLFVCIFIAFNYRNQCLFRLEQKIPNFNGAHFDLMLSNHLLSTFYFTYLVRSSHCMSVRLSPPFFSQMFIIAIFQPLAHRNFISSLFYTNHTFLSNPLPVPYLRNQPLYKIRSFLIFLTLISPSSVLPRQSTLRCALETILDLQTSSRPPPFRNYLLHTPTAPIYTPGQVRTSHIALLVDLYLPIRSLHKYHQPPPLATFTLTTSHFYKAVTFTMTTSTTVSTSTLASFLFTTSHFLQRSPSPTIASALAPTLASGKVYPQCLPYPHDPPLLQHSVLQHKQPFPPAISTPMYCLFQTIYTFSNDRFINNNNLYHPATSACIGFYTQTSPTFAK